MEERRPLVDAKVIAFLRSHVFARADFPIRDDGVVRLHPQLARVVATLRLASERVNQVVEEFRASLGEMTRKAPHMARL